MGRLLYLEAIEEYDSGQQAPGVASGQLMAHLSCSSQMRRGDLCTPAPDHTWPTFEAS